MQGLLYFLCSAVWSNSYCRSIWILSYYSGSIPLRCHIDCLLEHPNAARRWLFHAGTSHLKLYVNLVRSEDWIEYVIPLMKWCSKVLSIKEHILYTLNGMYWPNLTVEHNFMPILWYWILYALSRKIFILQRVGTSYTIRETNMVYDRVD